MHDFGEYIEHVEDIASIALFLACDDSRMLTATTIAADGGRSSYLKVYAGDE